MKLKLDKVHLLLKEYEKDVGGAFRLQWSNLDSLYYNFSTGSQNIWQVLAAEGTQYRSFHLWETTGGRAELV